MKKSLKNKKILLLLILLVLGLFIGSTSLAAVKCKIGGRIFCHEIECSLVDWPISPLGTDINPTCEERPLSLCQECQYTNLSKLIQYLYEWGIALGGLAAFIALLIAGFLYITSVGNPQQMADARGRMFSALFGLILLLSSWLILNTINPQLTTFHPPILSLETIIGPYQPCEKDEDCPENFKCKIPTGETEGFCFPEGMTLTPCSKVTLKYGDEEILLTKEKKCEGFGWDIEAGTSVKIIGDPPNCDGFVIFYLGEYCKKEHAYVQVGSLDKPFTYIPDQKIQTVKLIVIE